MEHPYFVVLPLLCRYANELFEDFWTNEKYVLTCLSFHIFVIILLCRL